DSFFDEGRTWDLAAAVDAGLAAGRDGADLVDIGGHGLPGGELHPGEPVPAAEESDRVEPVVAALRERLPRHVLLSVDTFHASVARDAIATGADVINDTTGLSDARMAPAVA